MPEEPVIIVEGLDELQKALARYPKEWRPIAHKAMGPGLALLVSRLHQSPPTPYKSGDLRSSIGSEIIRGIGSEVIGKVGTSKIYAAIHEYGDIIHAKNAPYLVFQTEDGEWHSVKSVKIPARPYMKPTAEKLKGKVIKLFEDGIARALKELGL